MGTHYKKLDWTKLSSEVTKELLAYSKTAPNVRPDQDDGYFQMYAVPKEIEDWCYTNLPITKEYKKFLTSPEVSNFQRSYTLISNGEVLAKSNGKFLTTLSRLKR